LRHSEEQGVEKKRDKEKDSQKKREKQDQGHLKKRKSLRGRMNGGRKTLAAEEIWTAILKYPPLGG